MFHIAEVYQSHGSVSQLQEVRQVTTSTCASTVHGDDEKRRRSREGKRMRGNRENPFLFIVSKSTLPSSSEIWVGYLLDERPQQGQEFLLYVVSPQFAQQCAFTSKQWKIGTYVCFIKLPLESRIYLQYALIPLKQMLYFISYLHLGHLQQSNCQRSISTRHQTKAYRQYSYRGRFHQKEFVLWLLLLCTLPYLNIENIDRFSLSPQFRIFVPSSHSSNIAILMKASPACFAQVLACKLKNFPPFLGIWLKIEKFYA